jgi:hypothetical protein
MLYRLELMLAAGECLTLAKPVLAEEIVAASPCIFSVWIPR